MKKRIALMRWAPWVMGVSLTLVAALLLGSLYLGPSNPSALPLSHLKIREVMLQNTSAVQDDDGAFYGWAEIANEGTIAIDLSKVTLTNNPDKPEKFAFSDTVVKAGECVVVYFSGNAEENRALYAPFLLNDEEETLYLFDKNGQEIHSLTVTGALPDLSYGILDGNGVWFVTPTPGQTNGGLHAATVDRLSDAVYTGVMINEACAVSAADGTYAYDWVELYNSTDTAVSLENYRLTESLDEQGLVFDDLTLQPHEYRVVYCDANGMEDDAVLCAPFSLNRSGDTVYLVTPEGIVCDQLRTGKQREGVSSGRLDAMRTLRYFFDEPTPGGENRNGYRGYTITPCMNQVGGYTDKGGTVTMTLPKNSRVYYTTDGSIPTEKSAEYTGETAISVKNTMVLRAVAYTEGYLPSDVVTNTFFTDAKHEIDVISVSGDPEELFGKNGAWTKYNNEALRPTVHTEYFSDEGVRQVEFDSVFRIAGGWSRENVQKAFSLNLSEKVGVSSVTYPFFEGNSVTTFDNLLLRPSGSDWDKGKVRDEFCALALWGTDGQLIQAVRPVALYMNGEYYGLYYLREKRNEDFIAAHTGIAKENVQLVQHPALDDHKTKLDPDLQELIDYAKKNDLRDEEHYSYVMSQVDGESLMQYFAYQTFFGNGDCINNITCYRDRENGKWRWIVFDMDWACTTFYQDRNFLQQLKDGTAYATYMNYHYPLMTALLKNEQFEKEFLTTYARLLQTTLASDRLLTIFDELTTTIQSEIPRQGETFGKPTAQRWAYECKTIRAFITGREKTMIAQLKSTFGLSTEEWTAIYEAATK